MQGMDDVAILRWVNGNDENGGAAVCIVTGRPPGTVGPKIRVDTTLEIGEIDRSDSAATARLYPDEDKANALDKSGRLAGSPVGHPNDVPGQRGPCLFGAKVKS